MEIAGRGDYHGLPTGYLDNGRLRLEFLWQAGPRLVRLTPAAGGANLLAEKPTLSWDTPNGRFSIRGGHRVWAAPESLARTCIPDDDGLEVSELPGGVRLQQQTERATGLRKAMELRLADAQPRLTIVHEILNDGPRPVELAVWAITMLRPGGVAILPQPTDPVDPDGLQPNRCLILWPRSRWDEARVHLGQEFLFVESRPAGAIAKFGTFARQGWLGYLRGDLLFVKRFEPCPELPHADLGCNLEVYLDDDYIELETLGPLAVLQPGEAAHHVETWEVHSRQGASDLPAPLALALVHLERQFPRSS